MKRKRSIITKLTAGLMLLLMLFPLFPVTSAAADVLWDSYEVPSTRQKELVYDDADLLSSAEEENLIERLEYLSEKWSCNVAVLTVYDYPGSQQDYADDYFDYNGFGADYNGNGVSLFLRLVSGAWRTLRKETACVMD